MRYFFDCSAKTHSNFLQAAETLENLVQAAEEIVHSARHDTKGVVSGGFADNGEISFSLSHWNTFTNVFAQLGVVAIVFDPGMRY